MGVTLPHPAEHRDSDTPALGGWQRIGLPLLVVPVSLAIGIAGLFALRALGASEDTQTAVTLVVGGLVLVLLALALWRRLPDGERRAMVAASPKGWARDVGLGAAASVAFIVTAGLVMLAGIALDDSVRRRLEELEPTFPGEPWQIALLAIGLVVLAPLGEELLFRGLLLDGFRRWVAFPAAAGITGVLFAASHIDAWLIWPRAIALALIGVLLAELYRRRGFLTVVIAHAGLNTFALIALAASA